MTEMHTDSDLSDAPPITELSKPQRRVLGVLVEKAFTTPEYYPLTLKAVTTGCNQKSNRSPVTSYSEDAVLETLDELRQLGLVAVVHTESGRTERFRHYMRKRFTFSEPQLAILTELLLRGRQQLGELRTRASRMVPIDTLDQLREELRGLQEMGYVQSSGPLERRGTEVDHNLYRANEGQQLQQMPPEAEPAAAATSPSAAPTVAPAAPRLGAGSDLSPRVAALESTVEDLRTENQSLQEEIESLRDEFRQLSDAFDDLKRELGG